MYSIGLIKVDLIVLGFSDLWGYQVYIAGRDNHAGHYDCHQINSEVHFTFCARAHCTGTHHLRPSIIYSTACDRIMQKAY